jgi:hypothetical protein
VRQGSRFGEAESRESYGVGCRIVPALGEPEEELAPASLVYGDVACIVSRVQLPILHSRATVSLRPISGGGLEKSESEERREGGGNQAGQVGDEEVRGQSRVRVGHCSDRVGAQQHQRGSPYKDNNELMRHAGSDEQNEGCFSCWPPGPEQPKQNQSPQGSRCRECKCCGLFR